MWQCEESNSKPHVYKMPYHWVILGPLIFKNIYIYMHTHIHICNFFSGLGCHTWQYSGPTPDCMGKGCSQGCSGDNVVSRIEPRPPMGYLCLLHIWILNVNCPYLLCTQSESPNNRFAPKLATPTWQNSRHCCLLRLFVFATAYPKNLWHTSACPSFRSTIHALCLSRMTTLVSKWIVLSS